MWRKEIETGIKWGMFRSSNHPILEFIVNSPAPHDLPPFTPPLLQATNAPKAIFLVANLLIMLCVPCRISYYFSVEKDPVFRIIEDELLSYAVAGSWFMMMFFAG